MKNALLVIDMQEDFFTFNPPLEQKRHALAVNINSLANLCRGAGVPVIWVTLEFEPDLSDGFLITREKQIRRTVRGTDGCKIIKELNTGAGDIFIVKKRYSAFFGTKLDEILNSLGADTLILAGINTHACIRMAAVDAYQRDLRVILASDCVASYDEDYHRESLRYLSGHIAQLLSNTDLQKILVESAG